MFLIFYNACRYITLEDINTNECRDILIRQIHGSDIIRSGLSHKSAKSKIFTLATSDFNDVRFVFGLKVALLYSDGAAIQYAQKKNENYQLLKIVYVREISPFVS